MAWVFWLWSSTRLQGTGWGCSQARAHLGWICLQALSSGGGRIQLLAWSLPRGLSIGQDTCGSGFLQCKRGTVSDNRMSTIFYNLIFWHILLIRNKLLSPAHTQEEGLPRASVPGGDPWKPSQKTTCYTYPVNLLYEVFATPSSCWPKPEI